MTQVDMNLLVALDVLLEEQSVTAAADRLNLSVPATSRTLVRIRRAFGDPILVRAGRRLVPTPHALALHDEVHRLVVEAGSLFVAGQPLALDQLDRRFTIRANDALVTQFAPRLLARLGAVAPGVTLRFAPEGEEDLAPLRNGSIDLDLGVIHDLGPEVQTHPLYQDRMVGLVAPGHPLGPGPVTLERLAEVPHVAVSRRGRSRGPLDDLLEARGLSRRVVAVVPTYAAAALLILSSDVTGLLAGFAARPMAAVTSAHLFAIPADLPPAPISLAWHTRHQADPPHQWLRAQIIQIAGQLVTERTAGPPGSGRSAPAQGAPGGPGS